MNKLDELIKERREYTDALQALKRPPPYRVYGGYTSGEYVCITVGSEDACEQAVVSVGHRGSSLDLYPEAVPTLYRLLGELLEDGNTSERNGEEA
jgi:hypothetical protein